VNALTAARTSTVLFAPGVSVHKMVKAMRGDADVVVLDLEDSVPENDKAQARLNLVEALVAAGERPGQVRTIRINNEGSWYQPDLDVLVEQFDSGAVQGVMLPKVSSIDELDSFVEAVGRQIPVWAVATETPEGVTNLVAIAAHASVAALCWGPEDLSVLMGSFGAREANGRLRPVYEWVRWQSLIAARAAGIEVFDTVFVDIGSPDQLETEALEAAEAGFTGKMAIHPGQLPIIEKAFRAPEDLIDWSRRLLAEREATGLGAFAFDGKMVDQPHFKLAARVIDRENRLASAGAQHDKEAVT
jgi:citrate lyase subunit beta/citryl-CoA lyase